jgi:hypothetical protein
MKDDEYELLKTKKRNNNVTYENDIYLTVDDDFEDFDRGVNILQELTENGIISEEEEKRRRELLRMYLDYQHALEYSTKVSTVSKKITFRCQNCLSCAHKAFEHCMGYVYYTDTD